jgi:Tol biopolymer transport system component
MLDSTQAGRTCFVSSLTLALIALIPTAHGIGQIVFESTVNENRDIYVMGEDGTNVRRLTEHPSGDTSPRWSPGGTRIAFISGRAGQADVYVMTADGQDVRRLTQDAEFVAAPAWSPDGRRIAFVAQYSEYGLHVMNADGQDVQLVATAPDLEGIPRSHFNTSSGLDWSPNGRTILCTVYAPVMDRAAVIWAIDADGRNTRKLSEGGHDGGQAWSPDGRNILFANSGVDPGLYTMLPDGRRRTRVADAPLGVQPRWSPDGQEIAFAFDDDIHVVGADGQGLRRLVEAPGVEGRLDWFDPDYARAVTPRAKAPATWGHVKASR